MVDNHEQPRRCNTYLLKKLFIILLIISVLVLSYTLVQTNIQVAVFDIASDHHRYDTLTYNKETDEAAHRGAMPFTNMIKEKADSEKETTVTVVQLEENTNETNVAPKHQPTANNGSTAVILLTYMRSGSSLTGDILQQPEDAFYVYEPIKNTRLKYLAEKTIHFINGTSMTYGKHDLQRIYEETLYGWLTCDLSRVYGESLLDTGFLAFGHKIRRYSVCIGRFRGLFGRLLKQNELHKNARFIECLNMLQHICSTSKFRIVKTIRTPMEVAKSLIHRIQNSKILHLVRDPRATFESQRHTSRCNRGLTLCIAEHCDNVRKDTAVEQSIKSKAPEQIRNVLYEDIASRPIATAQKMYSFVGMEFTETIANYVYNITLGYNKKGCRVCLARWQLGKSDASSETHISAWKEKLPGKFINQTQIICKDIIKNYGYEEYNAPPPDSKHKKSKIFKVS